MTWGLLAGSGLAWMFGVEVLAAGVATAEPVEPPPMAEPATPLTPEEIERARAAAESARRQLGEAEARAASSRPTPTVDDPSQAPGVAVPPPAPGVTSEPVAPGVAVPPPAPGVTSEPPAPGLAVPPPAPALPPAAPAPAVQIVPPAPAQAQPPPGPAFTLPPAPGVATPPPAPAIPPPASTVLPVPASPIPGVLPGQAPPPAAPPPGAGQLPSSRPETTAPITHPHTDLPAARPETTLPVKQPATTLPGTAPATTLPATLPPSPPSPPSSAATRPAVHTAAASPPPLEPAGEIEDAPPPPPPERVVVTRTVVVAAPAPPRPRASLQAGGGVMTFNDERMREVAGPGGYWDVRLVYGTRTPFAFELAYLGAAHFLSSSTFGEGATLLRNGAEAALRLNIPLYDRGPGGGLVAPFASAGIGWSRFQLVSADGDDDLLAPSDDVAVLPLGAGLAVSLGAVRVEARAEFRLTFLDDDVGDQRDPGRLRAFTAGAQLGYEF